MHAGVFLIYLGAVMLLVMAIVLWRLRTRYSQQEQIYGRINGYSPKVGLTASSLNWFERILQRAGYAESQKAYLVMSAVVVAAGVAGAVVNGFGGAIVAISLVLIVVYAFLFWRYQQRMTRITEQLPTFLEHVVRSMRTGRNLDGAISLAAQEVKEPLSGVMGRAQRIVNLGGSLPDALGETARLYNHQELYLMELGVRITLRYGGSSSDLFGSLVEVLRQRERHKRQLRAMTGETRVSAAVLVVLPVAIAAYMMVMNPDYLGTMLNDPVGYKVLIGSLLLQVTGMFIIWRMLRSI